MFCHVAPLVFRVVSKKRWKGVVICPIRAVPGKVNVSGPNSESTWHCQMRDKLLAEATNKKGLSQKKCRGPCWPEASGIPNIQSLQVMGHKITTSKFNLLICKAGNWVLWKEVLWSGPFYVVILSHLLFGFIRISDIILIYLHMLYI